MPKRILLADDSITIQKVVELTFSDGDYEVTAVNNGAKAIAKLAEMRPDIILSDIIMPEKNGYEVCEYVKSHPDFRTIPVILLTGTFEPFDPDRAEKAGSDAVVTKPFESQSLIQKVEELIAQAHKDAPTQASADTAAFTLDEPEAEPEPAAAGGGFAHESDIFGAAAPVAASASELPFEEPAAPAFSGETRAFPRMSFEELQQMASESPAAPAPPPPAASAPEPSPWDEPAAAPAFGGETRAFPSMSFEQLSQMASAPAAPAAPETSPWDEAPAPPPAAPEPAPWDEPAADSAFAGETRAMPRMSFEELQQLAAHTPSTPPPSPWDSTPSESASAAESTMPFSETPAPQPSPASEAAPWDEPAASPAYSGETRAFPRMSFEELQQMASASPAPAAPEPEPWDQPAPAAEPSWSPVESPVEEQPPMAQQEAPFEPEMSSAASAPEPSWASQPEPEAMPEPEPMPAAAAASSSSATSAPDLSDEQIERIARRVVEMMSEQVVKNIAWEVIPDLAEMVVKERIRQLEAEA